MAFHWPRADLDQLFCIRYLTSMVRYGTLLVCVEWKMLRVASGLEGLLSLRTVPSTLT